MGTKVHCESLHHSMRDLNNDSNGCRWPLFSPTDRSYNNAFPSSHATFEYDKDLVRRTMLDHEAVFKSQVLELHRVYRIQKDMMDELKRKQFNRDCFPIEASCSSHATTNDDVRKWYENGASSRNAETPAEVRPTKIRRKMIDLCLPADEYIDDDVEEVVELKDHRACGTPRQLPNGNVKAESYGYGLSRISNGLADLNEPFKAQETNQFANGHLRNGEFQGHIRSYEKSMYSGSVREVAPVIALHQNGKTKAWPHQPLRTDNYNGAHKSPFLQPAKPLDSSSSQPMQVLMNSSHRVVMGLHNPGPPPVLWRERTFIDLEADTNSSHQVIHESSLASHQPRHLNPYNPPDSSSGPWNHFWQTPSFASPQKVASAQRYPVVNLSDTLSGYAQKQGCLVGDRLQFESNSRFSSGCGNTVRSNYNECSSSKSNYNYRNGGRNDHSSANGYETKFVRDLNLNVTLSNTPVVEVRKKEPAAPLPWLVKPSSEMADRKQNLETNGDNGHEAGNRVRNLTWLETLKSGSCSNIPETEKTSVNMNEKGKVGKVRMPDMNELCDTLSDEDQQQMGTIVSVSGNKCGIDLNMSVSEEEEDDNWSAAPPTGSRLSSKTAMIDLETVPESDIEEDDVYGEEPAEVNLTEENTLEKAAETIVAISLACLDTETEAVAASVETSETVILHWFAETVDTHKENLDTFSKKNQPRCIKEIDYFESKSLRLDEAPGTAAAAVTSQRPRRGNARKGKQRRDNFQRDILPGLVPLSKHEVTEDIEMFDGFMRATGSSWKPTGLTRKKTGARGRPRRVVTVPEPVYCPVPLPPVQRQQQHVSSNSKSNNGETETCLEDRRFAGWGKMTRRPRRQRCSSTSASNQRSSSLV